MLIRCIILVAAVSGVAAASAGTASASVVVCSSYQASSVHFAMARYEQGRIFVRGWYNIGTGRCITIDEGFAAGPYAFYAYSDTTNQQWPSSKSGVEHCMKYKERFTVRYPVNPSGRVVCPTGYTTRFFQRFDPVNGDIRINVR
jgi:uncharacterized membrane protein